MRWFALLLAPGCAFGLSPSTEGEDSAPTTPTEPVEITLAISAIEPDYGMLDGGESVIIEGGPFVEGATVSFGGVSAEVTAVEKGALTVVAPEQDRAGLVDVVVSSGGRRVTATEGYSYLAEGAGKTGLIGEIAWIHYLGDYWPVPPTDGGTAWVSVIEPVRLAHYELYARAEGFCVANYESPIYQPVAGGDPVTLSHGGGAGLRMPWSEADEAFVGTLSSSDYVAETGYSLGGLDVAGFRELDLDEVGVTPGDFSLTSPALDGAEAVELDPDLDIRWSGAVGDTMIIYAGIQNQAGTGYDAVVSCLADPATGHAVIASSDWTSWTAGRQVDVYVGLSTVAAGSLAVNGAGTQLAGIYWVFGAGFAR